MGDLSIDEAQKIADLFLSHTDSDLYRLLHLESKIYRLAYDYMARFDLPLKAPDALHLAAASIENIPLITADRQLARNAEALGIEVGSIESLTTKHSSQQE
ncbi:MAG: type II toxin-antitoxin system VapC family toxin [Chloroflexota bacterium]